MHYYSMNKRPQSDTQQTKLSDIVLVLAPKGRVKNEYYHDFKASHGFEIPYADAYVYV